MNKPTVYLEAGFLPHTVNVVVMHPYSTERHYDQSVLKAQRILNGVSSYEIVCEDRLIIKMMGLRQ